jgi:hypothetical protein
MRSLICPALLVPAAVAQTGTTPPAEGGTPTVVAHVNVVYRLLD